MAENEAPEPSKYEKLTQRILEETGEHKSALEDAITHAWSAHTKANSDNHGEGLGEELYKTADAYVRGALLGIEGDLPGNDNLQGLIEGIIENTIGIDRSELIDMYKNEKTVNVKDLGSALEKMDESVGKFVQGVHSRKAKSFLDEDLSGFQDYIVELAQKVGLTEVTKDRMPTEKETMAMYQTVVSLYGNHKKSKDQVEALNKGIANYGSN